MHLEAPEAKKETVIVDTDHKQQSRKDKQPGLCIFLLRYFDQHIDGQTDFWGFNYNIEINSTDLEYFEKGKGDCCDYFGRFIANIFIFVWKVFTIFVKLSVLAIMIAIIVLAFMQVGTPKSEFNILE